MMMIILKIMIMIIILITISNIIIKGTITIKLYSINI